MSENPVIAGLYSDIKTVKTRSVVQIIVEVPIEQMPSVISTFGAPVPGNERWVALAALAFNPYANKQRTIEDHMGGEEGRRAVQSAVLRCRELSFQRWLLGREMTGNPQEDEARAVDRLKGLLGITSRSEIGSDPEKRAAWKRLIGRYEEEQRYGPPQ